MGKNDGVIIAAVVAGFLFLPGILGGKESKSSDSVLSGLTGGNVPSIDIGGLLGGLLGTLGMGGGAAQGEQTPPIDIGGIISSLLGGLGGSQSGQGGLLDPSGILSTVKGYIDNLFGGLSGGGGGGGGGATPTTDPLGVVATAITEPSRFVKALGESISTGAQGIGIGVNQAGEGAIELTKALAIGTASFLGFKALAPVAPVVGQTISNVGSAISPAIVKVASSIAGNTARALVTPITELTGVGMLGAGAAVVAAGAAGYGLGTLLMETTPLGEVTEKFSEELAVNVVKNQGLTAKVLGWEVAQVAPASESTMSNFEKKYGITLEEAQGMTTAQLQALIKNNK